jgi:hypothetical protein
MKMWWLLAGIAVVRIVHALFTGYSAIAGGPDARTREASRRSNARALLVVFVLLASSGAGLAIAGPRALAATVPLGVLLGVVLVWLGVVLVWTIARYVLVPLGLVRAAYYVSLASWKAPEEKVGTALLAAGMALHRKRGDIAEDAAWLEEKIQAESPLRGGVIVAAAATAAARGDRDGARALFQSIGALDPQACTEIAKHTAASFLAADAAARGAWDEVIEIGGELLRAGRSAWLLATVGKRLLGRPDAPGRFALLQSWLLAPRRRHTYAIVERALSVPDGAAPPLDDEDDTRAPAAPDGDALAKALAEHVRLLSMKKPAPADVVRAGRAFDAVFEEGSLPAELDDRAAELGATRAGHALACFREDVEESLFQVLRAHRIALDDTTLDLGVVAAAAQRRLRDETLAVIEALSDAVRIRVNERRALPAIDEWREVVALRAAYERGIALGGPELRYLAFTKVHSDVCALGVWLFNERKERLIGNAMFRFLLAEAHAVGDSQAIELQTKNAGCGV